MKTKAAVLVSHDLPLEIMDLDIPDLKSGQVLVRVAYTGICRSQINEIRGYKGHDRYLPHTLGHEATGVVERVGDDVNKVKEGDHVVLTWLKGEGSDGSQIQYSQDNNLKVNSGPISTFMTYAVVAENRLVVLPKEVPLKESVLFGCAVPTGAGIVLNTLKASKGNSIVVLGCGGIGMNAILAANVVGCKTIIAVDINPWKLKQAQKFGATAVINSRIEDVQQTVLDITQGRGCDFVVESSGVVEVMELGLGLIHNRGLVVLAGNVKNGEKIRIDPFELIKGKRIIGSWGGEANSDKDIPHYVQWLVDGKLPFGELLSEEFPLEKINEAVDSLEKGDVLRVVVSCCGDDGNL